MPNRIWTQRPHFSPAQPAAAAPNGGIAAIRASIRGFRARAAWQAPIESVAMSIAIVRTRGLSGMYAPQVTVEVHLAAGLPSFTLVGLPDTEVRESRERVRAALQTSRFEFPMRRITVNLAPADLPKESGRFDLPIALGILAASGQIPVRALEAYEFAGELSLSGELRPVRGALAMAYAVTRSATSRAPRGFVVPWESADEAALVGGIPIYAAK